MQSDRLAVRAGIETAAGALDRIGKGERIARARAAREHLGRHARKAGQRLGDPGARRRARTASTGNQRHLVRAATG